jgi:hypothetical protein
MSWQQDCSQVEETLEDQCQQENIGIVVKREKRRSLVKAAANQTQAFGKSKARTILTPSNTYCCQQSSMKKPLAIARGWSSLE